ncbi:MAG TPA: alpha/beta hydrolase [Acidimicrobiia bacterium]|nr:alpha/beta hydrolase [Acidimicrobiia bacterium]
MPPSRDTDVGVVLLHGAMLGRWIWERVEPRLGAPALAVDFPGRGEKPADITTLKLGDVVDSVVADIEAWPTPRIVLVAHSLAGIVAPGVIARLRQRVVHTVFVSAAVPLAGASYRDSLPGSQRLMLRFALLTQKKGLLSPAWATKRALCNDLDEPTTQLVIDNLTREAPGMYTSPVGEFPDAMPTTYVRLTSDRGLPPAVQDEMIARLHHMRLHEIDAGHLPMLGHPDRLARLLDAVVDGSGDES